MRWLELVNQQLYDRKSTQRKKKNERDDWNLSSATLWPEVHPKKLGPRGLGKNVTSKNVTQCNRNVNLPQESVSRVNTAILVINKLDSRFAVVRFCNHYRPNRTPFSPITSIWMDGGMDGWICTFLTNALHSVSRLWALPWTNSSLPVSAKFRQSLNVKLSELSTYISAEKFSHDAILIIFVSTRYQWLLLIKNKISAL